MAAGTLLYTTMLHILPEVYLDSNHEHGHHHHHHAPPQNDDEKPSEKVTKHLDERYSKPVQFFTLIAGLFAAELLTLI